MGRVLGAFIYFKDRWGEPSTQASLSAVCAMVGYQLDTGAVQDTLNILTLVFGALGFFFKEQSALTKV